MQTLRGAWALEARSSRAYLDGLNILSAAVEEAEIGRTMAAGAEAKVRRNDLDPIGPFFAQREREGQRLIHRDKR